MHAYTQACLSHARCLVLSLVFYVVCFVSFCAICLVSSSVLCPVSYVLRPVSFVGFLWFLGMVFLIAPILPHKVVAEISQVGYYWRGELL